MARNKVTLDNNTYLDSSSIVHKNELLSSYNIKQLPYLDYNAIDSTTVTSDYLEKYLKYMVSHYSFNIQETWIGTLHPNSAGTGIINFYGNDFVDGLPRYCSGFYFSLSSKIATFGTYNGVFYYQEH